eukprot:626178_1
MSSYIQFVVFLVTICHGSTSTPNTVCSVHRNDGGFKLMDLELPLPTRSFVGGININDKLYLIGGFDDSNDSINTDIYTLDLSLLEYTTDTYSSRTCTFTTTATFNTLRNPAPNVGPYNNSKIVNFYGQTYVTIEDAIYITFPFHAANDILLIFDMETEMYVNESDTTSIPFSDIDSCTMTDGDHLYIVGGYYFPRQTLMYVMGDYSGHWIWDSVYTNYDRRRSGCAFNKDGTYGYVFGGYLSTQSIEKYTSHRHGSDPSWNNVHGCLQEQHASTQCVLEQMTGYIFCIGGALMASYRSSVEIFDPDTDRVFEDHGISFTAALRDFVLLSYPLFTQYSALLMFGDILNQDTDSEDNIGNSDWDDDEDDNFMAIFFGAFFGGSCVLVMIVVLILIICKKHSENPNKENKAQMGHDVLQNAVHGNGWNHTKPVSVVTTTQETVPMSNAVNPIQSNQSQTQPQPQDEIVLVTLADGTVVAAKIMQGVSVVQPSTPIIANPEPSGQNEGGEGDVKHEQNEGGGQTNDATTAATEPFDVNSIKSPCD